MHLFHSSSFYLLFIWPAIFFSCTSYSHVDKNLEEIASLPEWRYLLQFTSNKSRILAHSPFFLSPNGSIDPHSELLKTIDAFQKDQHTLCRFPYRALFLERHLQLNLKKIPCPELKIWEDKLKNDHIELIFASQFISNPGSVMGHTFLLFRNEQMPPLLNTTVNYAADIPPQAGAWDYVTKGLMGGFPGVFSDVPYYQKIHEYNNMEQRDLWEYRLKLTPEQRQALVYYLWELKNEAIIPYYFLDENCSFLLVSVLQAIFPEKELIKNFDYYVVPHETIKVLKEADLIGQENYRPSIQKQVTTDYESLSEDEKKQFRLTLKNHRLVEDISPQTLNSLIDFFALQKQKYEGKLPQVWSSLRETTLIQRSKFPAVISPTPLPPSSPLETHRPLAIELERGQHNILGPYWGGQFYPGIHRRTDQNAGFLPQSTFSFFEFDLRYYQELQKTQLNRLTLINMFSGQTSQGIEHPLTWKFNFEMAKEPTNSCLNCGLVNTTVGIGKSYRYQNIDLHLLLTHQLQTGHALRNGVRTWLGPEIELISIHRRFLFQFTNKFSTDLTDQNNLTYFSTLLQVKRFHLFPHYHLGVEIRYHSYINKLAPQTFSSMVLSHDF